MLFRGCMLVVLRCPAEDVLRQMVGPSRMEQWMYWKSQTPQQIDRVATIKELEKLLQSDVVSPRAFLLVRIGLCLMLHSFAPMNHRPYPFPQKLSVSVEALSMST